MLPAASVPFPPSPALAARSSLAAGPGGAAAVARAVTGRAVAAVAALLPGAALAAVAARAARTRLGRHHELILGGAGQRQAAGDGDGGHGAGDAVVAARARGSRRPLLPGCAGPAAFARHACGDACARSAGRRLGPSAGGWAGWRPALRSVPRMLKSPLYPAGGAPARVERGAAEVQRRGPGDDAAAIQQFDAVGQVDHLQAAVRRRDVPHGVDLHGRASRRRGGPARRLGRSAGRRLGRPAGCRLGGPVRRRLVCSAGVVWAVPPGVTWVVT